MKRIVCIVGIYMAWAMMSVSIVPIEIYVKRVAYKKQYTKIVKKASPRREKTSRIFLSFQGKRIYRIV